MNKKNFSRRQFISLSTLTSAGLLFMPGTAWGNLRVDRKIRAYGPASTYRAKLKAAFIRREEEYGMKWPGQIYDGEAAKRKYTELIRSASDKLNLILDIEEKPLYSLEEGKVWIAGAKEEKTDGMLLVTLDRQEHTWPVVSEASDSGIPLVVFSPLGTSFTTNTDEFAHKAGTLVCSTDDFTQAETGIKMIHAAARIRESRFLVIKGDQYADSGIAHFGTKLRYIPAEEFKKEYEQLPVDREVISLADDLILHATHMHGPVRQDVLNGIKSYLVARNLMKREKADGISMDCLGALGNTDISLPCISWSRMNDHGIPAACEADLGACISHALVQYLFDRPGFQQDPVAETVQDCLIGSHCSCPTRLDGFDKPATGYSLVNHHGKRDATPKPLWKVGQRITVLDVLMDNRGDWLTTDPGEVSATPKMIISTGEVVDNKAVPPAGGCVVAPMVRLDHVNETLDYPGFHQLFFYGDYKNELVDYCKLFDIEPVVV